MPGKNFPDNKDLKLLKLNSWYKTEKKKKNKEINLKTSANS